MREKEKDCAANSYFAIVQERFIAYHVIISSLLYLEVNRENGKSWTKL